MLGSKGEKPVGFLPGVKEIAASWKEEQFHGHLWQMSKSYCAPIVEWLDLTAFQLYDRAYRRFQMRFYIIFPLITLCKHKVIEKR